MSDISDYGLLGDCQGAALLSRDGSVDWWCASRFDAPSVFGRLLDENAGHWSIRPAEEYTVTRRYLPGSMVIETEFICTSGRLRLTDALALGSGERGHRIGFSSPHVLLRRLEALEGTVSVEVELVPRPEYGLITPSLSTMRTDPDAGLAAAAGLKITGGADQLTLTSDRTLHIESGQAAGSFRLSAGESTTFALQHRHAADPPPNPVDGPELLDDTKAGWRSWSELHQGYSGPYREQVQRSALVLQALTYQPTGAVIAAATTSLPEEPGGEANWDYRFGWLRDGSLTMKALWVAACPDEGQRFFEWIASSAGPTRKDALPVMLGAAGEHDLTEHQLDHLAGYAGSRPVRVGNDAWEQTQLDVLGEVLECAWILRDQLHDLSSATLEFLTSIADRAAADWEQPDSGIWEGREGDRHYLTSKLMCWVALDRAVKLAPQLNAHEHARHWKSTRDQIRTAILERGWNEDVPAFTGAFGSDHLDAGMLLLPIVGFLPADDERVVATLDAIERDLSTDHLVQRWTGAGEEGAFLLCSYWLATGRAMAGEVGRAKDIFTTATSYANDLGLLSEEVDIRSGALLGNFPQALSHIGLINAAWAIAQAEQGEEDPGQTWTGGPAR